MHGGVIINVLGFSLLFKDLAVRQELLYTEMTGTHSEQKRQLGNYMIKFYMSERQAVILRSSQVPET